MAVQVSVTMLTKNSEKRLGAVLSALTGFAEVIVLDTGSTDATMTISQSFSNVRLFQSPFLGFGNLKNLAASHASHDWVFNVDSDEMVTETLAQEIASLDWPDRTVYAMSRLNHYRQRPVRCCGWHPDFVTRIYNKKQTRFSDRQIHEALLTDGLRVRRLGGSLLHYPFDEAADLINKMQFYSGLYAREQRLSSPSSTTKGIFRAMFAFFHSYILQKGLFWGGDGLTISLTNAGGVFLKYRKLLEENQNLKISLVVTTHNRPDALRLVLQSIARQRVLPDEVVVADDGSEEETRRLISEFQAGFPVPLEHIWQPYQGFRAARCRNLALAKARFEYIVLIDGDMILERSFVLDHKAAAQKNRFVQGSRVLLGRRPTINLLEGRKVLPGFAWSGLANRKNLLRLPWLAERLAPQGQTVHGIRTCNFAFFLEDALRVNGFNERFVGWGREDSEFAARLMHAGVRRKNLRFAAVACHLWHPPGQRENLPHNDLLLQTALKEKHAWCPEGIDKHFQGSGAPSEKSVAD